ncbi:hypothetical protein [Aeromonas phage phiWae14]|nr:hypothetical protein [Aeromonas phage phiWae14]
MSNDLDARANRGSGNQCSKAWYDAPLWKNVGPLARKKAAEAAAKAEKEKEVVYNATETCNNDSVVVEDDLKAKQRKLFAFAY